MIHIVSGLMTVTLSRGAPHTTAARLVKRVAYLCAARSRLGVGSMHRRQLPDRGPATGGGLRGDVGNFTAASRGRLRDAVWAVRAAVLPPPGARWFRERPAHLVTLTYPAEDDARLRDDPRLPKTHLREWWRRVLRDLCERSVPPWAIWVLALDRNGRPRFHLLVRWSPGGGGYTWLDVRDEVVSSWAQVIAAGRKGPKAGTPPAAVARIELRITEDRLARYLTNAGVPGPSAGQGRWWGILGRDAYAATVAGDRRAGLAKEANHAGGHRSESSSTAPSRR